MMQQLPIGEQNFANLRQLNMLYVDKTEQIYQLLKGGRYNFLSRPRRFGKSLTLSTIQYIFEGKKEIFRGLWIEDQWDWALTHPVIHLSFNTLDYHNLGLETALVHYLDRRAETAGIRFDTIKKAVRDWVSKEV